MTGFFAKVHEEAMWLHGLLEMRQYQAIQFIITVERKSTFFKYFLTIQPVLLTIVTLCLYWVPVQSGERFTLGYQDFNCSSTVA